MANEDQNSHNEEKKNEDNLMAELQQFNEGSSSEVEDVQESTEEIQELQSDENSDKEPENESQVEQWLIDNKFKNDEEGVQKLADAYKQLQSKSDKERNQWNSKQEKFEKLEQLDNFLAENPEVVKKLSEAVGEKQKEYSGPPQKPEDYDILDESVDNSSSAKWRKAHDEWLIKQGAFQAMQEVEKLKAELSQSQAFDAETAELQKMGLSDTEIVEYRQFMADPNNVTQENLVQIWKSLSNGNNPTQEVVKAEEPKKKTKQTSPASVTGQAPKAIQPEEKAIDNFWNGIMKYNRK